MRKIISAACMMFIACACIAQQRELDSLLQILESHQQNDSTKLKALLDISFDYSSIDPDKGLEKAEEAILLAKKLNDQQRLASAINYKGVNFEAKSLEDSAITYYNRALDIRKKTGDNTGVAKILHNIGIVYFNLSDYTKALDFQQQSLAIFENNNYNRGIAGDLNSIGVIFLTIADYPRSLDSYLKALRIYEKGNDGMSIAMVSSNIGIIYNHLSDYNKALKYHFEALKIYKESGNKNGEQQALGNIGNCYDDLNQPKKALGYYQQGLAIAEEQGFKMGIANSLSNMGTVYNKLRDYKNASTHLNQAIDIYKKLGNESGLASAYNQLGNTYRNATFLAGAPNKSDRYQKAISYFDQSLQSAIKTGTLDTQGESWQQLSETYKDKKDFERALNAYKNYIIIRDSIFNDQRKQDITRLEIQHEYNKKEALLKSEADKKQALAATEIRRHRLVKNIIALGAGIILFAAAIVFIFYKRKRDAQQQQKEAEFKAQVTDTEIKALRSQMNPHFIFNSLNSINDYISKNDLKSADTYLVKFAKIMRLILENSEKKEVRLSDDLQALELYMQLESLRLNNKFTYNIKISDAIDVENTLIPPLLLQPFVENSIWHGISGKQGNGKILIRIEKENEMIKCTIEDDGIGRIKSGILKEEKNNNEKSFGMKITHARIEIINKIKKSNAGVELSDLADGTKVELKLPLELSF
ncbi:MAG: tetratricopeptide repeat protein [Bacteroidetes bacterium]|nr:tetratricopeptide repeat protein [Bacteroidota bacterium]